MTSLDEVRKKLENLKPVLNEKFQVETIGIFGSFSRGEQKTRSDIDVLVTFEEPNDIDLFDLVELNQFLSEKLKLKVDVVQKRNLKHQIKDKILQETIYI